MHGMAQSQQSGTIAVAVDSRVARASYGTLCNIVPFDAAEHDDEDRVFDDVHQDFLAVDQARWFLTIVCFFHHSVHEKNEE